MIIDKNEIITYLRNKSSQSFFKIDRIFFRGSILDNTQTSKSDVDILVVSDFFDKISIIKRKEIVSILFEKYPIDSICLTKSEFSKINEYIEISKINKKLEKIYEDK